MKKLKTETFGLTCTPSFNMDSEIKEVTELVVSWGGGMGGSTKTVYGEILSSYDNTINFKDYLGVETVYTKTFIVSVGKKQLVTITNNIFPHLSYNGNRPGCKDAVETTHYIVDMLTNVEFDFDNYIQKKKLTRFVDKF